MTNKQFSLRLIFHSVINFVSIPCWLQNQFYQVSHCRKHQKSCSYLDFLTEIPLFKFYDVSKWKSGRSNSQNSNRFVRSVSSSKKFSIKLHSAKVVDVFNSSTHWSPKDWIDCYFKHHKEDSVQGSFRIESGNFK